MSKRTDVVITEFTGELVSIVVDHAIRQTGWGACDQRLRSEGYRFPEDKPCGPWNAIASLYHSFHVFLDTIPNVLDDPESNRRAFASSAFLRVISGSDRPRPK